MNARRIGRIVPKTLIWAVILALLGWWAGVAIQQNRHEGAIQATQTLLANRERIPEVRFNAIAFDELIPMMSEWSGAQIDVDWETLEEAGVKSQAPVTVRLRDVKVTKAIDTILADVGGAMVHPPPRQTPRRPRAVS